MDAGSRPSCSTFDPGPCHWPRKTSRVWSKCMGPFLPCGRPRCSSFPTSVCSVVAIEATWAMNRRSLSSLFLCFPPSLSNSASNKEIKPCYFSTRRRSGKYVEWIHNNSSKILIDILKKKKNPEVWLHHSPYPQLFWSYTTRILQTWYFIFFSPLKLTQHFMSMDFLLPGNSPR